MHKLRAASLIFLLASFTMISCGGQDKEAPEKVSDSEQQQKEQKNDSLFFVNLDASVIENLKKDESYEINLIGSETYILKVRRVSEHIKGVKSISANVGDAETGLANFIIQDNKIYGSMELYKENKRYHIGYDSLEASYYLQEVDRNDILEGSEPLTPKDNRNK